MLHVLNTARQGMGKGAVGSENKFVLQTGFCFDLQQPLNNFSCIRKVCPCPSENIIFVLVCSPQTGSTFWSYKKASQNRSIKGWIKFWLSLGPEKFSLCSWYLPSQWFPRNEIIVAGESPCHGSRNPDLEASYETEWNELGFLFTAWGKKQRRDIKKKKV